MFIAPVTGGMGPHRHTFRNGDTSLRGRIEVMCQKYGILGTIRVINYQGYRIIQHLSFMNVTRVTKVIKIWLDCTKYCIRIT